MKIILKEYLKNWYVFLIAIPFMSFGFSLGMLCIWIVGEITKNMGLTYFLAFFICGFFGTFPIHILNYRLIKIVNKPKTLLLLSVLEIILFPTLSYIILIISSFISNNL